MREMKDSGVEWIGAIPVSWSTIKNKYIFRLRSGEAISKEALIDEGLYPVYGGGERIGYYNKYNVSSNSFLIGRVGARCGCVTPVNSLCWATDNALIAEIDDMNDYYTYALIAANLNRLNESNAQPLITATKVLNVSIPKPDKKEQLFIVEFLNNRSNECDTLIIDIQSQIETLEEYKRSVITEAVTKGLDRDVEMRDSGVAWIGKIPKHWKVDNPKWHFVQRKDRATKGLTQLTASQKYGVVTQEEYMEITGAKVVTVEKDFDILKLVCPGDFIIHMRSFQGGLEYSEKYGSISSAYVMLIPQKTILEPRFYKWFFKSPVYIDALSSTSNLIRDGQAMRYANFIQLPIPLMPKEEQQQIADYLDRKCAEIDSIISEKKQQIETIEEYKKSLIFEYVTGKKEVDI